MLLDVFNGPRVANLARRAKRKFTNSLRIADNRSRPALHSEHGAGGKLANVVDLMDVRFGEAFRGRFPDGGALLLPRKVWELSWLADRFEALNVNGSVLGLGVGHEPLIYHFAHLAREVVATDLFSLGTAWCQARLATESVFDASPFPYPRERLQVRNMDMRQIDFPAERFDAIWSCSSVEHVQTIPQFVQIFREIHRTLKPGGFALITTEFSLGEPFFLPGVLSLWRGCSLFTDRLEGLTLLGPVDLTHHDEIAGNLPTARRDVHRLAMHRDYTSGPCGFCLNVGYGQTIPVALAFRKTGPNFNWPDLLGAPAWYAPFAAGIEVFEDKSRSAEAAVFFSQALALADLPGARLHCYKMLIEAQVHAGEVENLQRTLADCEQRFREFPEDDDALDLIGFVAAGAGHLPFARRCWESAYSSRSVMPGSRLRIRINQLEAELREYGSSTEAHHLNRLAESAWHEAVDFLGAGDIFLKQLEDRLQAVRSLGGLQTPTRPVSVSSASPGANSVPVHRGNANGATSSPLLCYFGHHKCGTTWITRVLEDVCAQAGIKARAHADENGFNGDIEQLRAHDPFDFWIYANAEITFVRPVNLRGFHVVRDPRDVIVSAYFSHMHSHSDEHWPRLRQYRPHLRQLTKHDGLLAEMEFNAYFLAQMLMWDYQQPNVLELRFEDMVASPEASFEKALNFLGLVPDRLGSEAAREIVRNYSFERMSGGRRAGVENPHHHYRMGQPGEWRKHFEPAHIDYFKRLYNPLLMKLGYEKNEDWG